jgi:hypothetical protein
MKCTSVLIGMGYVGTMQIGYLHIQASSQGKEQGMHPCAAMCSTALDCTPCRCGVWRCHVSCSSGPHLPAEAGSSAATCPIASNLASLPGWALVLPCRFGTLLPAKEGSSAAMCPTVLDTASLLGSALALPRTLWLSVGRGPQI